MKHWIKAFRLRTLPLALSCILAGHATAALFVDIDWNIFALAALTTIFLQVLSNLANDYGDSENGADHEGRKGPSRAVQSGAISKAAMKKAVFISAILSLISGVGLLILAIDEINLAFVGFFLLGLASIVAAIKYTMGKNPYGYKAMGDLFVFLFFGIVGVAGSYWLQTGSFHIASIFLSFGIGFFSVGVLNMNNMRDVESDKIAGKVTIPILIGNKDKVYHSLLIIAGIGCVVTFVELYATNDLLRLAYLLFIPFLLNLKKANSFKERQELDPELKKIALSTFFISIALLLMIVLL